MENLIFVQWDIKYFEASDRRSDGLVGKRS